MREPGGKAFRGKAIPLLEVADRAEGERLVILAGKLARDGSGRMLLPYFDPDADPDRALDEAKARLQVVLDALRERRRQRADGG